MIVSVSRVAKLGTKHVCPCGARFYDLGKPDACCPKCGSAPRTVASTVGESVVLVPPSADDSEDPDMAVDDDEMEDLRELAAAVARLDAGRGRK